MSDLVAVTRSWIESMQDADRDSESKNVDRHEGLGVGIPEHLIIGVVEGA